MAAIAGLLMASPMAAQAIQQTDNDRTPTWSRFRVKATSAAEPGVFYGMAASCRFPEQYPPKRPNPRWETERPSRRHFVEHLNPAFDACSIKPFVALPQFTDYPLHAELVLDFEKALPPGFEPLRSGERSATMKTNLATHQGRQFALPELTGSQDQWVTVRFSVLGKPLSTIRFRIDSQHTLKFHEYDRSADVGGPQLVRKWSAP